MKDAFVGFVSVFGIIFQATFVSGWAFFLMSNGTEISKDDHIYYDVRSCPVEPLMEYYVMGVGATSLLSFLYLILKYRIHAGKPEVGEEEIKSFKSVRDRKLFLRGQRGSDEEDGPSSVVPTLSKRSRKKAKVGANRKRIDNNPSPDESVEDSLKNRTDRFPLVFVIFVSLHVGWQAVGGYSIFSAVKKLRALHDVEWHVSDDKCSMSLFWFITMMFSSQVLMMIFAVYYLSSSDASGFDVKPFLKAVVSMFSMWVRTS